MLEVKGRASHAGAAPEQGRNAAIELSHQLLRTRDIAKDIPGAQLNWTNLRTDNPSNQIPALAIAVGDVRITQPGADEKLKAALQAKLGFHAKDEYIEIDSIVPRLYLATRLLVEFGRQ